ncbi:unnamed protein product [Chrysoparadoxa australica]
MEAVQEQNIDSLSKKMINAVKQTPMLLKDVAKAIGAWLLEVARDPKVLRVKYQESKHHFVEMMQSYWIGTKLLWKDIKTARRIARQLAKGDTLTRREERQLIRTSTDVLRMVPLSIFLIVPFMEFLLPFALRLFPNLLPSTFKDKKRVLEADRKQLRVRSALAGVMQEMLKSLAKEKRKQKLEGNAEEGEEGDDTMGLQELQAFLEKTKLGRLTNKDIERFAHFFRDELLLDNMARPQLLAMCRYMGLSQLGSDNFLRILLRSHGRTLQADDRKIMWEGVDSLTHPELQEACRARGMRTIGLTRKGYERQLRNWLDLSTNKNVPISLLIMSRGFTLDPPDGEALAASISQIGEDVVTEVILEAASDTDKQTADYRTLKLESVERQNELIKDEEEKRKTAAATKKKEEAEQEAAEEAAAAASTSAEADALPMEGASSAEAEVAEKGPEAVEEVLEKVARKLAYEAEELEKAAKETKKLDEGDGAKPILESTVKGKEKAAEEPFDVSLGRAQGAEKSSEPVLTEAEVIATLASGERDVNGEGEAKDKSHPTLEFMLDKLETGTKVLEEKLGAQEHLLDCAPESTVSPQDLLWVLNNALMDEPAGDKVENARAQLLSMDENSDGQVTVEELILWVEKNSDRPTHEVFDELHAHRLEQEALEEEEARKKEEEGNEADPEMGEVKPLGETERQAFEESVGKEKEKKGR